MGWGEFIQPTIALAMGWLASGRLKELNNQQYEQADAQLALAEDLHARIMALHSRDSSLIAAASDVPVYSQQYACQRSRAHADAMRISHQERVSAHKSRSKYQIGIGREIELTTMVKMGSLSISRQVDAENFEDTVHDETVAARIRSIVGILSSNPSYLPRAFRASGDVYKGQSGIAAGQINGALATLGDSAGRAYERRQSKDSAPPPLLGPPGVGADGLPTTQQDEGGLQ